MHLSYDKRDNCLEMLSTVGIYPAMANQSQLMGQSVWGQSTEYII